MIIIVVSKVFGWSVRNTSYIWSQVTVMKCELNNGILVIGLNWTWNYLSNVWDFHFLIDVFVDFLSSEKYYNNLENSEGKLLKIKFGGGHQKSTNLNDNNVKNPINFFGVHLDRGFKSIIQTSIIQIINSIFL